MQRHDLIDRFRNFGFNSWLLLLGVSVIFLSLTFWIYAYYPLLGQDYSYWIAQLYELRIAWERFGKLVYDFSPVRCLGLPAFSHPNTLQLSLFHFAGLLTNSVLAIQSVFFFLLLFSYFGTFQLCRYLHLDKSVSILFALGWVLQGWIATRVMVGHVPFIHLALAPWILYILVSRRSIPGLLAAAFWISHSLYSAAFYTTIIMLIGVLLGLVALRILQPGNNQWTWKTVAQNFSLVMAAVSLIILPKIIGSLDFVALFPRDQVLLRVSPDGPLVYALANLFFPLPYNVQQVTGWSYGPWEAYQYLLPLLFPALVFILVRKHSTVAWKPILLVFGSLIAISVLLTSGALHNLISALPILKALHVNPRWNGVILLPMFLLALVAVRKTGFLAQSSWTNRSGVLFFFLVFSITPVLFVAPASGGLFYQDGYGIDSDKNRVGFCYEPMFGYKLEVFPGLHADMDWISGPLRDPRCYLASGRCRPGTEVADTDVRNRLASFSLQQPNSLVRWSRPFAIVVYLISLVGAVIVFAGMAANTFRQCRDGARS